MTELLQRRLAERRVKLLSRLGKEPEAEMTEDEFDDAIDEVLNVAFYLMSCRMKLRA